MHLGYFTHSGSVVLPLPAELDGVHTVEYRMWGTAYRIDFAARKGEPFEVPNKFNENTTISFKIRQPDGELYKYSYWRQSGLGFMTHDDDTECFEIDTNITFDLSEMFNLESLIDSCPMCDCSKFDLNALKRS